MRSRLVSCNRGPQTFWAAGPLPTLSPPRRLAALTGPRQFMDAALRRLPGGRGHAERRTHTPRHGPGEGTLPPGQPPLGNPRKGAERAGEARGTEAAPKRDPKQRGAPPRAAAAPPSPSPGPREQRAAPARRHHRPPYLTETAAEPPPPPAGAAQAEDAGTALPWGPRGVPGAARHAGTRSPPRGPRLLVSPRPCASPGSRHRRRRARLRASPGSGLRCCRRRPGGAVRPRGCPRGCGRGLRCRRPGGGGQKAAGAGGPAGGALLLSSLRCLGAVAVTGSAGAGSP